MWTVAFGIVLHLLIADIIIIIGINLDTSETVLHSLLRMVMHGYSADIILMLYLYLYLPLDF
jgi:hypothetical protein